MIYWIVRQIIKIYLLSYHRFSIQEMGKIDNKKQYIYAVNHFSFLDLFIIIAVANKKSIVAYKADFFNKTIPRLLLYLVNGIPIKSDTICYNSIKYIIKEINNGKNLLISPAGKISKEGRLQEFKDGASFIAFKTKTMVVPVVIINSNKALPLGKTIPRPYKIIAKIGKPIVTDFSNSNKEAIKKYTLMIKNEIILLLNQGNDNEKLF